MTTIKLEEKFRKTEYGKKLYKQAMLFTIIFVSLIIVELGLETFNIYSENEITLLLSDVLDLATWLLFGISLYFDGKYEGASDIYKKRLK